MPFTVEMVEMTETEIQRRTKDYLVENFMYMRKHKELGDDDSLLRTGVISSLGMMELVGWVEETFTLAVDPSEITEQTFDTVRCIARFVAGKGNGTTA